jgi:hypothetical protein
MKLSAVAIEHSVAISSDRLSNSRTRLQATHSFLHRQVMRTFIAVVACIAAGAAMSIDQSH